MVQVPRLIACDVDGTLLDNGGRATSRTVAMVARVAAAEVPFVLATGRSPRWVLPVVDELGYAGLAVCANGAVLYDAAAARVLSMTTLDPVRLLEIAEALVDAIPGCQLAVERVDATTLSAEEQFVAELNYVHPWSEPQTRRASREEVLSRPAVKLLVWLPGMTSEAMAMAATAVLGDAVTVTFSTDDGLIELTPPGVTKGFGLAALARRLDIRREDVIAFGDMPNDLPMLAWAGHGVAMANAHPSVLTVADEVAAPNTEDGVAMVLERWFSP